ncbi:MAG TPA: polymer-forming cytoskeletal protein [Candidatus Bathyarchaeia archaeon]
MNIGYSEFPEASIRGSGRVHIEGHGSVKVSGRAELSPQLISTSGSSHLPGGLTVRELESSGSTEVDGDLSADTIRFRGSATIRGDARFRRMEKSGSLRVEGGVEGSFMEGSGSTEVGGKASVSHELLSSGSLTVEGGIESGGRVEVRGSIRTRGVKADRIEILLGGSLSRVTEGLEAKYIRVEPRDWRDGELRTGKVEGGEVILENVECDTVTGSKVHIGDGCRVNGRVTYTESIHVSPNAYLKEPPEKTETH